MKIWHVSDPLMELPDGAVAEMKEGEFHEYQVVRIADEFVVEVMFVRMRH